MSFSAFAEQSVRIAVGRFQEEVQIKGQNIKVQPMDLPAFTARDGVQCEPAKEGFRCDGKLLLTDKLRITSSERLYLKDHEYRRELELISREHQKKPEILVVHPYP